MRVKGAGAYGAPGTEDGMGVAYVSPAHAGAASGRERGGGTRAPSER